MSDTPRTNLPLPTLTRIATAVAMTAALAVGIGPAPAHGATNPGDGPVTTQAAEPAKKKARKRTRHQRVVALGNRVIKVARTKRGTPYRYGATGPNAFDCSGYTRWVYARLGKKLPRTSRDQAAATKRIGRKDARRGDLVFFHRSGRVYHVGLYAGRGRIWHAPYGNRTVAREKIWTGSVFFGRHRALRG